MKSLLANTFVRFLLVGGFMAGVYALLAALATSQLPIPKPLSSALAWLICIPPAYWLQSTFTFAGSRRHRAAFGLYAGVQALSIVIVAVVSQLLANGIFLHDVVVHLFGSALAAVSSYLINRHFVFPQNHPPES